MTSQQLGSAETTVSTPLDVTVYTARVTGRAVFDAASAWLPFFVSRLGSVDAAEEMLSELYLWLWERRAEFDPEKGDLRSWAGGFARNLVAAHHRNLSRRPTSELHENLVDPTLPVAEIAEHRLVLRAIAANISRPVYSVWMARAFEPGSMADQARAAGVSVPRFRALVDEGAITAYTARAAVQAALAGERPSLETIARCVSEKHGLQEIISHLTADNPLQAVMLAREVSAPRAKQLLALARRMLRVADSSFELAQNERRNHGRRPAA